MIALTFLLLIGCLATAIYSRQYYMWCGTIFLFGLLCMVFSNAMYMQILTNVHFNSVSPDSFIIRIANIFSLSVSNIRIISLIGEIIILVFFTLILTKQIRKKALFYVISAVCICSYLWSELPNVMFSFWLKINSASEETVRRAEMLLNIIQITRYLMMVYFLAAPYVICFYKYIKTSFMIIKRNMLNVMLYTGAFEIILLLCIGFNFINSFTDVVPTIFYNENLPEIYTMRGYMLAIFFMLGVYVSIIVLRGKLTAVYYMQASVKDIYGKYKVDKNIKMILHSYKNMFFAIRQLSDNDMYGSNLPPESETMITTIHSIADNALYGLTKQIEMLDKLNIEIEKFKISKSIRMAVEKCTPVEKRIISVRYMTDEEFINSDAFYLSDAIYNILKNSAEAVAEKKDGAISVTVSYEENWFLIDITDNGCGIEREKMKEIFKPLISYKNGSGNWGIGLYYSYRIINTLKGCICLKSNPREYTNFQIYMPQNIKNVEQKNITKKDR